jgi:3-oxoacyl-[acyl-carrier protein] reductase
MKTNDNMSDLGLKNKVVLITGTNNPMGIGAATALQFCYEGAKVALVYKRVFSDYNEELKGENGTDKYNKSRRADCNHLESLIKPITNDYMIIEDDITIEGAPERIFDQIEDKFGLIDVLVNNAAEYEEINDTITKLDSGIINKVFDVNVKATLLMIKEFVLRNKGWGRIINISTDAAQAFAGQITYGSSKAANEAFTRSIAIDVGSKGITVNCVSPGPTQTGYIDKELERLVLPDIPLERIGQPEDIANAIVFLASEKASWITGNVLKVSGGHCL